MNIQRLPDAELVVMKIVWKHGGDITSAYVCDELKGQKEWAVPTVLNFLARLVNRGFLSTRRNGKTNIYTPLIGEEEYLKIESRSFLKRLHDNSLTSLVTSLYSGETISRDDLEELRQYLNGLEGEQ